MKELALLGGEPILSNPLQIRRDTITDEDKKAVEEYFKSDGPISFYGDEGIQHEYEQELKTYFSYRYALLVNSGTNALLAAYFALGLMPGDEVLVPAFSFFAIASPLLLLHITPVMVDCNPCTGLIDTDDVERKITEHTKAVVINHICGDSIDMHTFTELCHQRKITVIEDLSLAFGATDHGKKLGTFGDLTCCSLGSTKLLSGGQGGFIVTNSMEYYERMILLGCFGKRASQNVINPFYRQFSQVSYGMNIRMHPLSIAISYGRFKRCDSLIKERHIRYNMLSTYIKKFSFINPPRFDVEKHRGSWHGYYAVLNDSFDDAVGQRIADAFCAEGIPVHFGAHYPLLHRQRVYWSNSDGIFRNKKNPYKTNQPFEPCVGAEYYHHHILSFPLFLDEDESEILACCEAVEKIFSQIDKLKKNS